MKKCLREECNNTTNNPKYCSLSCSVKCQPRLKTSHTKKCKLESCAKDFECSGSVNPKVFCSRSCSAKYNNRRRGGYKSCLRCGKELLHGRKYCSQQCGAEYRYENFISDWLCGKVVSSSESGVSSRIRRYLLEESEYRCSSPTCCVLGGWGEINPKSGKSPLTIDHIDGDASNNRRENLRVLCPNCHALTDTYGALNAGNGRKYRLKRYHEGKTW